jgi:hypothetical protein
LVYGLFFPAKTRIPVVERPIYQWFHLRFFHPYVHAVITDGAFTSDDNFIPLPEIAVEPFLKLWEQKIFALLLNEIDIPHSIVM